MFQLEFGWVVAVHTTSEIFLATSTHFNFFKGCSVFRQRTSEIMDVADVQDLEVWGERNGCLVAAVCGVGLQTFGLVGSG